MKKHMKKIIIGGAILIVLGFGSVAIYHGINKNVPEPIEKATDTDAYVSNEDNAGNDVTTTALADNSKDKDTTTEKDKEDSKDTSTEMASNTGDTSSANTGNHTTIINNGGTQNTTSGNSNNSSGNVNGKTNGGTKPNTTESPKPSTKESSKPNATTEAPKPNNNSNQNNNSNECDHNWEKVIKKTWIEPVEHTEEVTRVIEEAKDVPIVEQQRHIFCTGCGGDLTSMGLTSVDYYIAHCMACQGGNASYYGDTVDVITGYEHVPAKTVTESKTVVDKEGYWKEEVTGYKCTKCGTTKSK